MSDSTNEFTHLSGSDLPRMVDISEKTVTERKAVAVARVYLGAELAELVRVSGNTKKSVSREEKIPKKMRLFPLM